LEKEKLSFFTVARDLRNEGWEAICKKLRITVLEDE
jgi:hypothetical protein